MLRASRICKNIASISSWTWVMPNLVKAWKSAGILPLCITGYEIFTFSCLSIFFGPRGISGYPRHGPQSTRWITRRLSLYKLLLAFAGLDSTKTWNYSTKKKILTKSCITPVTCVSCDLNTYCFKMHTWINKAQWLVFFFYPSSDYY